MRTHRRTAREEEREDVRAVPHPQREDAILALQRGGGNQAAQRVLAAARSAERLPSISVSESAGRGIQRWAPSSLERQQLTDANARLAELEEEYKKDKALIMDALEVRGMFNDALQYLHKMDLGYIGERVAAADKFFEEAKQLARQAATSKSSFDSFLRKLNAYDKSGGKNAVKSAVRDLERKLKTQQRDELTQITKLDEDAFKRYRAGSKPPLKVYRGDGRDINANSLDNYQFQDVIAGGTPDISFYGVVQHTHTNTFKNGMVSTASSKDVAHFWATSKHKYGIVFEIELDDYIHVANLLKKRNFKDRYPAQYEVMAPGNIPASKVVSATLYQDGVEFKKVTNGG